MNKRLTAAVAAGVLLAASALGVNAALGFSRDAVQHPSLDCPAGACLWDEPNFGGESRAHLSSRADELGSADDSAKSVANRFHTDLSLYSEPFQIGRRLTLAPGMSANSLSSFPISAEPPFSESTWGEKISSFHQR